MAEKKLKTLQFEGLNTTYVLPEVDPTSSIPGDAADAKIVGDHLTDINNPHGVTLEQLGASKTIVTDENQDGHIILKSYLSDSGSGNISTHISDRSNPHKVTAVQVGADVSGAAKQALEDAKGYTDEVITNLIGGAPDTLNTLQELAEAMGANAEVVEVLEKAITGKADNSVLTTHIDNKNNPHNVTIEQIGAAPAGYGLGTYAQLLTADHNLNDPLPTGLYRWGSSVPINAPSPIGYAVMLHIARTNSDSIQKVWHIGMHSGVQISCERYLSDSEGEWEWTNPPMDTDVEYRTAERIRGKAVYKKKNSSDQILYRLDGETEWKTQASLMGAAPEAHTRQKNNPHAVTAEQVGALRSETQAIDDWNQAIYNGFYRSSASCINGPVAGSQYHGVMINYTSVLGNQFVFKTWADGVSEIWTRRYYNGEFGAWHPVLTDKNVGTYAAPSGYGLGIVSYSMPYIEDAHQATKNGWYRVDNTGTQNGLNVSGVMRVDGYSNSTFCQTLYSGSYSSAYPAVLQRWFRSGVWDTEWSWINPPMNPGVEYRTTEFSNNGKPVYKKNVDGVIYYRLDGETEWKPYSNIVGAAPAGYGYGGTVPYVSVSDMWTDSSYNTALDGLLSGMADGEAKQIRIPYIDGTTTVGTVYKATSDYATVVCYGYGTNGFIARKTKYNGWWQDWEWENPPMQPGVAYRTTERHQGNSVYTMLVNCGEMVNDTSVTYAQNVTTIRYAGFAGGVPLPFLGREGFNGGWALWMSVNGGEITIHGGSGYANTTINTKAQVWYTKN